MMKNAWYDGPGHTLAGIHQQLGIHGLTFLGHALNGIDTAQYVGDVAKPY